MYTKIIFVKVEKKITRKLPSIKGIDLNSVIVSSLTVKIKASVITTNSGLQRFSYNINMLYILDLFFAI